jgi:ATP-dependent helicase/nuclease subunit A
MTAPAPHLAILASAGSGKTRALTTRYIALAALGAPVQSILATTFTRAAAAEIRDRVLGRLAEAAASETRRAELQREVGAPLPPARVRELLAALVAQLPALQMRTLDSFFAAVVRTFEMNLDLPPGAAIADGAKAVALRREAVRAMLDEADPQPLVDLLRELTAGQAERGVTAIIDRTVIGLHETYRESAPGAWDTIDEWPTLDGDALAAAISAAEQVGEAAHWPDNRQKEAFGKHLAIARAAHPTFADHWEAFLSKGLTGALVAGSATYQRKPIPDGVIASLDPLIAHAKGALRNSVASRTRAAHALMERYDAAYRAARRRLRAITFADLTHSVAEASHDVPLDDLYFRLDARVQHLLLDEMQDTSVPQWRAVEPIAREILDTFDGSRTFFCVGDVKQSIYGWRTAAPELLAGIDRLSPAIARDTLDRSWRSSPVVIDLVNRVFTDMAANAALGEYAPAAAAWDSRFVRHDVAERLRDLPGIVELRIARGAGEEETAEHARLADAADLVASLHARAPDRTIGVLTRTNKAAARLLHELGPSKRGLPAGSRGGGSITDAAPVNVILDLLRLGDHPDHTIASFNVARSPLGPIVGLGDDGLDRAERLRVASDVRRVTQQDGFATTIERWADAILPAADAHQARRLLELVELAARFDAHRGLRCDDFVAFAEAADLASSAHAAPPIEVMTIHKAKGLEFDIVVLPDLQGEIASTRRMDVAIEREGAAGPVTRVVRWVKQEIWSLFDDLRPLFEAHVQRVAGESLCLLYVAMTRARQGLYLLIDPPGTNKDGSPSKRHVKSTAGIVADALVADGVALEPCSTAFRHGDDAWLDEAKAAGADPAAPVALPRGPIVLAPSRRGARRAGAAGSPSAEAEQADVRHLGETLALGDRDARDHGLAMHALFERIEWLDEAAERGLGDGAALRTVVRRAAPGRDGAWVDARIDAFRDSLGRPAVRALFQPPANLGTPRVWRELRFARDTADGLQSGSIDRLEAAFDDQGRCLAARVIDFKTDSIAPDACADRAAHYRPQMLAYQRAASELLGVDPATISMTVAFVDTGRVVELNRPRPDVQP